MKVIGTCLQQTQGEAVSQQHSISGYRKGAGPVKRSLEGVNLPSLASPQGKDLLRVWGVGGR